MEKNYRKTLLACYLGFITQAIAANFAPLLFLKLHTDYAIPLGKIALIPTAFFLTQLLVDVLCAKFVDSIGYRRSIVMSEVTSCLGLAGLAFIPDLLGDPFIGILICVVIYAIGSGLIEVLVSPIVEACPFDHKDAVMSLLHSFYCWGCVGVILLSTAFFAVFGIDNWKWLACIWALVPLYNIFNFATCPIERLTEEGKGMTIRGLFKLRIFWIAIVLMVCAGASELAMAQWASAFTEAALGFSKTVGDLIGPLPVRRHYGYLPGDLREVRPEDGPDKVHDRLRRPVPVLLPAGQPVRQPGAGPGGLRVLRLLRGHHVAGNDQHHLAPDSHRRYGAVRPAGHGGGPGWCLRPEPGGHRDPAGGGQPAVRHAGGEHFPAGADYCPGAAGQENKKELMNEKAGAAEEAAPVCFPGFYFAQ